jgi:hypothetical protein
VRARRHPGIEQVGDPSAVGAEDLDAHDVVANEIERERRLSTGGIAERSDLECPGQGLRILPQGDPAALDVDVH